MTGLEIILIPCVTGVAGVALGKIWGSNGRVTMERCELIHNMIDNKLKRIEDKIDILNKNGRDAQ